MTNDYIEISCSKCNFLNKLLFSESDCKTTITCTACQHPILWQICQQCATASYIEEKEYPDGICNACLQQAIATPANQMGKLRLFFSTPCPYCSYPINSIRAILDGKSPTFCPECTKASGPTGLLKAYLFIFLYLPAVALFMDIINLKAYLPGKFFLLSLPIIFAGGIIISSKIIKLEQDE